MTEDICKAVTSVVFDVGGFIKNWATKHDRDKIEDKSHNSFVTEVDVAAEEMLVEGLSAIYPEAGFITEEKTVVQKDHEMEWIIDPIDGTTNYIYQIPAYSVSVALCQNRRPVLGVVYSVANDELFYTWQDAPAFLNDKELKVNQCPHLEKALLVTGFPYERTEMLDKYMAIFKEFLLRTRGVRRLGSAALDLAYVAAGRFDGFYEHQLNPWDVAAGVLLVQNAGGRVLDFSGGQDYLFGGEIIASAVDISNEMQKVIAGIMNEK